MGQVLEYAANGQCYWSGSDIRMQADATAKENGTTIEETFRKLQSDIADNVDSFFKEVERRLKSGEVRIVFFLEQAPTELKRLVEFLNRQMGSVEVLLIEARQYTGSGVNVVVPTLFGFTEQVREIKRTLSVERGRKAVAIDWESFKVNAEQKGLDELSIAGMRKVYDTCKCLQADIVWGRGTVTGSFSPKWTSISSNVAPFSVYADGKLEPHFSSLNTTEAGRSFGAVLAKHISQGGLTLPNDYLTTWFSYGANDWLPKVDMFVAGLESAIRGQALQAASS